MMTDKKPAASEEQLLYARILQIGMRVGLLGLAATCVMYLFGILPASVPLNDISNYWQLSVNDYMAATGTHAGWAWVHYIGKGDYLNFAPMAVLAGITIVCYAAIIPGLLRKGDKVYAVISALEVLVLVVAASGVLGSGGH
jgi:hypothetical protein